MQRTWSMIVALGVVIGYAGFAASQPETLERVMQVKLGHAQEILEALALEDFDALESHGRDLGQLTELASWGALRTPEYTRLSGDFRDATQYLVDAAVERSLDGAALAYVEMTLKCVQCHKHVRGARLARGPDPVGDEVIAGRVGAP